MTENPKEISLSAKEHPIKKIFGGDYLFEVPEYQRPYSWTTEQASALVTDLQEHKAGKSQNPYFLGSIVLIKGHEANSQIIDGQQRLATLTILFSVLRYLINNQKFKRDITGYLCEEEHAIEKRKEAFRILLGDRDKDFFQENIQKIDGIKTLLDSKEELKDSRLNIKQNAKYMHDRLKDESQAALEGLIRFVASSCYLVVVTTPDIDSAYRIFSVMNDRGLNLTATDILKSDIIGAIPTKSERRNYSDKWVAIEERIGRDKFSDLFSYIRMIYRKAKPQGTLIKEFHDHVKPRENPKQFIDAKLLPYSNAYANIIDANFASEEKAECINAILGWLNRIDNSDWVPPAIYYLSQNKDQPDNLLAFLKGLERLGASMMVSRKNINDRITRYSKLLAWIMDGKDVLSSESPIHLTNDEIDATLSALRSDVYENDRTRLMILLRLDSLLSDGSATYNQKVITVEHVLPQNPKPSSEWIEWIPDEETRNNLVHKLGNLALLSKRKNSAASNYELAKKKTAYFTDQGVSPFAITTDVLDKNTWTEDVILERQEKFIGKLIQEWNLKKA